MRYWLRQRSLWLALLVGVGLLVPVVSLFTSFVAVADGATPLSLFVTMVGLGILALLFGGFLAHASACAARGRRLAESGATQGREQATVRVIRKPDTGRTQRRGASRRLQRAGRPQPLPALARPEPTKQDEQSD